MTTEELAKPGASAASSGASAEGRGDSSPVARRHALIFLLLLLASLPFRLVHLGNPIEGEHEFRQTQTSLSVWEFRENGVSLLHPKLPLFGPPWECPLEYPLFQLAAAAIDSIAPWHNLDASIRLTAILFFYLCAIAFYLLARQLFKRPAIPLFAAAIFLLSPYNLVWSRASMIEYAAGFFALAYLLCFIRWTSRPGWPLFVFTILFGVLACLTKITSFALPLFVVGVLMALHVFGLLRQRLVFLRKLPRARETTPPAAGPVSANTSAAVLQPSRLLLAAALVLLPLFIGLLYVRFSDHIKARSPYTAWLCSNHPYLKKWNYGTLAQRLNASNWKLILTRIRYTVLWDLWIPLLVGIFAFPFRTRSFEKLPAGNFWIGAAFALSPLAVILCFFNLYCIHNYYFIAVAPVIALCTGIGVDFFFSLVKRPFIQALLLLLLTGLWLREFTPFAADICVPSAPDLRAIYLSQAGKIIPKDDPVIVVSPSEYNSFIPYNLKRRAFMAMFINKPVDTRPLVETDYFKQNGFHWLLLDGRSPAAQQLATQIMHHWKFARPVKVTFGPYTLYSLSDQ